MRKVFKRQNGQQSAGDLEGTVHQQDYLPRSVISCPGCSAREEQLVFLREQVRTLQDKLLCLVPEAADRDHRLRLTQMANMRPEVLNGIIPLNQTVPETDDQALDEFMGQFTNPMQRRKA